MTQSDQIMRDVADADEPAALSDNISYKIRLLQIASYKIFEKTVRGFGSAPRYYGMLKLIEANPGIPQTRLAEAIFLDRSSLVPILETLTKEGWIERKSNSQDKRVRQAFLTEIGSTQLAKLEAHVRAHEAMISEGLSPEEKAQLVSLLGRLDENLRRASGFKLS